MLNIEYFTNVFFRQGAAYSEGCAFNDRIAAADDINDQGPELYLETIWRKRNGTSEIVDLSGTAGELAAYDASESGSWRQHIGLSRQIAQGS